MFDVVVLGATGVTGRQAVRHLVKRSAETNGAFRWAVAGRDPQRLRDLLAEFDCPDHVRAIHADTADSASLHHCAQMSTVIVNFVGPYADHGRAVYEACIANGTHQVDVCGEIDWLAATIRDLHDAAVDADVCIAHSAGFEALPFELGVHALARHVADNNDRLVDVDVAVAVERDPPILSPIDLVSGGTLVSGTEALRRGNTDAMRDARLLDPRPHEPLPFDVAPRRHRGTGEWIGPMAPSPYLNPAVIHRGTVDTPGFAPGFSYREGLVAADLFLGVPAPIAASMMAAGNAWITALASAPTPWRTMAADMMQAFGPRPGQGPDAARLDGWHWQLDFDALTEQGDRLQLSAQGIGHPGYRSSANFAAGLGMGLADSSPAATGIVSPATAVGGLWTWADNAGLSLGQVRSADTHET